MTTPNCHPDRPHRARGLCSSCYTGYVVRGQRQRNGRYYQHTDLTKLEAAIARWGTPHKAEEQTGLPFDDLWAAWQRIEAANAPVQARGRKTRYEPCGTYAAYKRHRRKGEAPDQACKTAHAVETQARRLRSLEAS